MNCLQPTIYSAIPNAGGPTRGLNVVLASSSSRICKGSEDEDEEEEEERGCGENPLLPPSFSKSLRVS